MWFIVSVFRQREKSVVKQLKARLSSSGSMQNIADNIHEIKWESHAPKGYIFINAESIFDVEKLCGIRQFNIGKAKGVKKILGQTTIEEVENAFTIPDLSSWLEVGGEYIITDGAFKNERVCVESVNEKENVASVYLMDAAVALTLTVSTDDLRVDRRSL